MFNIYTYEKMQKEEELRKKEKLKLQIYERKRNSKYINNNKNI